jgi:hypothetical protein
MRHGPAFAACLAGVALLATVAVRAQSFVGVGPVRSFVLPTEPRGEPAPVPASVSSVPTPAPRGEIRASDTLRRLPATLRGFRFNGEWAQTEWPVYLTSGQARQPARFQLAFLSAISVMPEGSRLTLAINDKVVAQTELAPPDSVATRIFEIPAGLLNAGFNAVKITVEQRHRVDCSPAATYELWTALDPALSGLLLAGGSSRLGPETPADIAAIAPRGDGATPIRLLLAGKLTPESAGRAIRAAQIATLAGRMQHPAIEFVTTGRADPGLELAIGTVEELSGQANLADLGPVTGPRYGFLPARPERAATFVITGTSAADLDEALRRWDSERTSAAALTGSSAGLRALSTLPGFVASGASEHIVFSQTGFASTEFSGRLMRLRLDVALPGDFLPADYDRMTLSLAGSHGRDLSRDAHVLVEVNGRNAATQMLAPGAAGSLERNQIFLPLSLMQPGQNRIDLLAQVPKPADEACTSPSAGETRLHLLDRSELVLPRQARIGRSPELSLLAAGGYPFSREGARPILFVPAPDRASMAAAATLTARLAVAAGKPIDFTFTMTPPATDAGEVLLVAAAPALDPAWIRGAGLDPERIRTSWQPTQTERRALPSEADALARRCALPPARLATPVGTETKPAAASGYTVLGLRASLPALPFWQPAEPPGAGSEAEIVTARAALLVGQDFASDKDFASSKADHLWTLVTAADAGTLLAGVECLTHPEIWSGLSGRISALASDETLRFVPAGERQRFVTTQGYDLANARLVAAGWLSLNPLAYVGIALALVLCLAASTLLLVLNTGRRQE